MKKSTTDSVSRIRAEEARDRLDDLEKNPDVLKICCDRVLDVLREESSVTPLSIRDRARLLLRAIERNAGMSEESDPSPSAA